MKYRKLERLIRSFLPAVLLALCLCGCQKAAQAEKGVSTLSEELPLLTQYPGLEIRDIAMEKDNLVLQIINNGEKDFSYAYPGIMEMWVDGAWHPLVCTDELGGTELAWTDMAYDILSGDTRTVSIWLKPYDASCLQSGKYRLVLNCCLEQEDWELVGIVFEIED